MAKAQSGRRFSSGAAVGAGLAVAAVAVIGRRIRQRATAGQPLPVRGRALITGASSGIGEAFARRLAVEGFDLTLVARREERLRSLADELSAAHGIKAEALAADLAHDEDIDRIAGHIEGLPDLALLINNAGFGTRGYFADVELGRQLDMIRVHVVASVTLARAALPRMIGRGAGAIINVSSIAAFFPSPGGASYSATKAYLNTFSEALAAELDGTGVRVQALCPGFTYSGFHDTTEYGDFDRKQIPDALWMSADAVVDESLAALATRRVVVVPGRQYRGIMAAVNSPFRGPIRDAARAIRRRWQPG